MAPKGSKSKSNKPRVESTSPYVQANILGDESVAALEDGLRSKRPALRPMSQLLKSLPFNYSAIFTEQSLFEWLQPVVGDAVADTDFLLVNILSTPPWFYVDPFCVKDYAKYLDWWERSGIYNEPAEGRDRKRLKELRLVIRRFGLETREVEPAPDQFLTIQLASPLIWTDTHQWLILLMFFDILCDLRNLPTSAVFRVPPSPAQLFDIMDKLQPGWLSMRVNWPLSVKASIQVVKAAHGLGEEDDLTMDTLASLRSLTVTGQGQSTHTGPLVAPPFVYPGSPDSSESSASPSAPEVLTMVPFGTGSQDKMRQLFAKLDSMSLSVAFDRIMPSVKKADEQGQYLAMTVNIQLAALAVNYIQANVREANTFSLRDITQNIAAPERVEWMGPRYIFQPFMIMVAYSPLFLLARTRLYSSPLPSFAVAFEIFKLKGNAGKPPALRALEHSIWALVLQVAQGSSVYQLLPIYMSAWIADIDIDEVDECKTWLDDFGKRPETDERSRITEWDGKDIVKLSAAYTAERDKLRAWSPGLNEHGKRRASPPDDAVPAKRPVKSCWVYRKRRKAERECRHFLKAEADGDCQLAWKVFHSPVKRYFYADNAVSF
ncbi:unnamed protein product [Peniophora sp. CBMAI 1063]|nr:unnamed protein product [Peniophora sp. CBMAI 1063]